MPDRSSPDTFPVPLLLAPHRCVSYLLAGSKLDGITTSTRTLRRTVQRRAQGGPQVLKVPVRPPRRHYAAGCVQGGEVAFECDVTGSHGNARAHALECAAAAVVAAQGCSNSL